MFQKISELCSAILCVCNFRASLSSEVLRVFQGLDAVPGEFPYAVALVNKISAETQPDLYWTFCSGNIITSIWTLTAGHCIEAIQDMWSAPRINITSKPKLAIRYVISLEDKRFDWGASDIISIQLHPGYKSITTEENDLVLLNDIGLAKTKSAIVSMLGKLSSVDYQTLYGHEVLTAGFGLMKLEDVVDDALSLNKSLQVYKGIVVKCSHKKYIYRPTLCISWKCNTPATSCAGDSGGPIIHATGIIAVLSAGDNMYCNSTNVDNAGVATPLSPYINWIFKHIKET